MKFRALLLTLALTAGAGVALPGAAHADGPPKNLKVLKANGKKFKAGMKSLTKGLGVKCKACHIKGKFDSDEMKEKIAGREFLEATVGKKDKAAREAALKTLLGVMKIDKAKDAKKIWAGVDMFERK